MGITAKLNEFAFLFGEIQDYFPAPWESLILSNMIAGAAKMFETEKSRRIRILFIIGVNTIMLLLGRLLWLQVLHGPEYKKFSEENAVRKIILAAPRGAVYDQNGIVLVGKQAKLCSGQFYRRILYKSGSNL